MKQVLLITSVLAVILYSQLCNSGTVKPKKKIPFMNRTEEELESVVNKIILECIQLEEGIVYMVSKIEQNLETNKNKRQNPNKEECKKLLQFKKSKLPIIQQCVDKASKFMREILKIRLKLNICQSVNMGAEKCEKDADVSYTKLTQQHRSALETVKKNVHEKQDTINAQYRYCLQYIKTLANMIDPYTKPCEDASYYLNVRNGDLTWRGCSTKKIVEEVKTEEIV